MPNFPCTPQQPPRSQQPGLPVQKLINEVTIKALKPSDPRYDCWDTQLPRFGVRVGKRRKTFICNIGKRRKVLGHYPHISVKDARDAAKRLLYAKYLPKVSSNALTLTEDYQKAISGDLRPTSLTAYALYLRRVPNKALSAITPQEWYAALPQGKASANLCFKVFKSFLSWCLERGHVEHHPLANRKQPNKLKTRDRLLTDEEVKAIWIACGNHNSFGVLIRLLLLSGQRLNQLCHLQTAWINTDKSICWPAAYMKNNQEHTLPLTPVLASHLSSLNGTPYIWGDKPYQHPQNGMKLFKLTLPQIQDWRLHDFRRLLSSRMAALGVKQEVVERLLAHRSGVVSGVAAVYNRHEYQDEMRAALILYHEHLRRVGCVIECTN